MAPYLLFGFVIAGALSVFISAETVERHLGKRGFWSTFKAALFGVPLPLCSCGVIPVGASIHRHGASRGATVSFLLSTPQTGVDSILATYGMLGPVLAIFRPIVAFVSGLFGGILVDAITPPETKDIAEKEAHDINVDAGASCSGECCTPEPSESRFHRAVVYGLVTLPRDIARALVIGIFIAGAMGVLIDNQAFAAYLGRGSGIANELLAMFIMMIVGLPVYVCATASIPVALAFIAAGASPGAALVFLMTGPATNAATISTIWKTMGRRTAVAYISTVAVTAVIAGLLLNQFVTSTAIMDHVHHHGTAEVAWWETASKWAMLVVLVWSVASKYIRRKAHHIETGESMRKFKVVGMSCGHCQKAVEVALKEVSKVEDVEVDLDSGIALIKGDAKFEEMKTKVESAGYNFEEIKE